MNRATIHCLWGGVVMLSAVCIGACSTVPDLGQMGRQPPAIIPINPTDPTLQRTFAVDLRSYPDAARINWDFGDGTMSPNMPLTTGQRVTHDYRAGGTYVVAVHLFSEKNWIDNRGSQLLGSGSLPVDVIAPNRDPVASFTITGVQNGLGVDVPLSKSFNASASIDPDGSIQSYLWDFGDGSTGTGKTIEHAYTLSGRYVVRLTVTDNRGGTGTTTQSVMVNSLPTPRFTATVDPGDALRFTFDGSASSDPDGPISEYRWDFGDGTTGAGQMVVHKYAIPNNYTVKLTVMDSLGVAISTSQTIDAIGSALFVQSITPNFGQIATTVSDAVVAGKNFKDGATVRLTGGGNTIAATSVIFDSSTSLRASFDLTGAVLGSYSVVVENPGGETATTSATDAFRVVTPDHVRLTTSKGDVVLQLVSDAPITTANFLRYVQETYYDGTIFHRVISGFIVQGGGILPDGTEKPGVHGPIQNEFSPTRSNVRGTVAMAKLPDDPNSATNQFFVNLADNSSNLDNQNGGFTVFANVIEGMDVIDAIAVVPVDANDRPVEDVLLISARRE